MSTSQRISQQKLIHDKENHGKFLIHYLKIINDLELKFDVRMDASLGPLVNFDTNKRIPIHRWFVYKEGYSDLLVRKLIFMSNCEALKDYILDPFAGVGTTLVTSRSMNIKSVGLEVNPVATFAAKVKTYNYSQTDINEIKNYLSNLEELLQTSETRPKYKRLSSIFTANQLEQVLKIKGFYENIHKKHIRDFFKLAYLSIIEDCSDRIKDGNGIKIAKNKQPIEFVIQYFVERCHIMVKDLRDASLKGVPNTIMIHGSILDDNVLKEIKHIPISLAIFSPPYANCFDYCEQYKMEIWLGDFVKDYSDFAQFRKPAIRSHVNAKFDPTISNSNINVNIIASLVSTYNIWNKHIPDMIRGYFDDMEKVLERIYSILKPASMCYIIVANSSYRGIIVPTDLLLAEIAEKIGFQVKEILVARQMRASSQQTKDLRDKSNLMRESIITLLK